jgi:hypothetical protein
MISGTWDNADPPAEPSEDADGDRLRPAWADTPDETDADLGHRPAPHQAKVPPQPGGWPGNAPTPAWLAPLCDATDALARLDARAAAAPDAVRDGLIARMAYAEAAGWLAHTHAWIHPLDLALRDLALTGSTALAATGAGPRVLPHTFAARGGRSGAGGGAASSDADWDTPAFDTLAAGDRAVADALALARQLRRLAGPRRDPFASPAEADATLGTFGAGPLDPARFAQWRAALPPAAPRRRGAGAGPPALPSLLVAAWAAEGWMEFGITEPPAPLAAVLAGVCLLARTGPARAVFVPVWAAYPAVAFGDRDALPALRADVADRVVGWGGGGQGSAGIRRWNATGGLAVPWPVAFLHLVAESARSGLRDLDRLLQAAEQGRGLTAQADRRSRLPDALDAALRTPALTPKALAGKLRVAPQTATALLHALQTAGLMREVTGRKSFRAFAV